MTDYIMDFKDHGQFYPDGKIDPPLSISDLKKHNKTLDIQTIEDIKQSGRGILYLSYEIDPNDVKKIKHYKVTTWAENWKDENPLVFIGNHNICGPNSRRDVYFYIDEEKYHGVNIGDFTGILHVKRIKRKVYKNATKS